MGSHGTRNWNDIAAAARDLLASYDADLVIDDEIDRLRSLLSTVDASRADEPTEAEQLRRLVKLHSGAHQLCGEAFIHMGEAVITKIAEGGTLAEVLDIVGDCMNERDAVDEDCEALFDRAKAALVGGRSAAPTRDEVRTKLLAAVDVWTPAHGGWSQSVSVDKATDAVVALLSRSAPPNRDLAAAAQAVLWAWETRHEPDTALYRRLDDLRALLSRSAAEPPEAVRALQAIVDDDVYAHTLSGLAQFRANALATARAALAAGVAAEPREHDDGR